MKIISFLLIASIILAVVSCQKTITAIDISNSIDTTITPGDDDTAIVPPGTGPLLSRYVSTWKDFPTSPGNDSEVTEYTYDGAGFLVRQQTGSQPAVLYTRDGRERLISTKFEGASDQTNIYYVSAISNRVAYVLYSSAATAKPDSNVFSYDNGYVAKTTYYRDKGAGMQLQFYQTYNYDSRGNITKVQFYVNNALNIGYEFEYDDKVNPLYSNDDARVVYEWAYYTSPNNVKRQINHYGDPPVSPSDNVTLAYDYNAAGQPVSSVRSGTALGTQTDNVKYYYK